MDASSSATAVSSGAIATLVKQHRVLINYALIGGSAAAIDLLLFLLFHNLFGWTSVLAHAVSVAVSVVWSFALNARYNFKTEDKLGQRFVSFASVAMLGLILGAAIIVLLERRADVSGGFAKVISMPLVFITQYLLNSRVSFRKEQA